MTTLFGYDPENEAAIARNYAAAPRATVDTDGWLLQPIKGVGYGVAQTLGTYSATVNYSLAAAWKMGGALTGLETADEIAQALQESGDSSLDFIAERKRDAARSGMGAQITSGILTPLLSAAPLAATGPTGFALGAGLTAGIGTQAEIKDQTDAVTAVQAGLLSAAVNTVGFRIPAGFWSSGYARTMAGGAAANIALGQGELYGLHEILTEKGYTEAAKQYEPWNPVNAGVDGALGAVFGAFHVRFNSGLLRARQEIRLDAMGREAVPGLPKNAEAVDENVRAVDTATEQLLRGEPVEVEVNPVNFTDEMPPPRPLETAMERAVTEETGVQSLEALDFEASATRAADATTAAVERLPTQALDTMPQGTLYHGSAQPDMTVAGVGGEANLVGPGAYISESPEYSSTYAGKTGELYVANPPEVELFPFTGTLEAARAKKLLEDLGADVAFIKDKIGRKQRVGGDTLYGAAVDRLGSKAAANAWLKKNGYGGIAFTDRATQVRNRAYFDPVPLRKLDEAVTEQRAKQLGVEQPTAMARATGESGGKPAPKQELSLVDMVDEEMAARRKLSKESQATMNKLEEVLRRNPAALVDGDEAAVPLKAMMQDMREMLGEADHAPELFNTLAQCALGI